MVIISDVIGLTGPDTVFLRRNVLKKQQQHCTQTERATKQEKKRWTAIDLAFSSLPHIFVPFAAVTDRHIIV